MSSSNSDRWNDFPGVDPILTTDVVNEHNRPAEGNKDISQWFTTEYLTVDFGDDEGRPSEYFTLKRDYLIQFIQNGWKPENVESVSANGDWTNDIVSSETSVSTSGDTTSSTNNSKSTRNDGDAYWWIRQRIRLARRRMQPENVLSDIIKTYVTQYNAGISGEDGRFNEVVQLYQIMLHHTETEANAIVQDARARDVQGIFDYYRKGLGYSWDEARRSAQSLESAVNEGAETETRIKFENLIAKTKSQMIGQGTYNGTVWPTVEAGILRQMREAIAAIKAEGSGKVAAAYDTVLKSRGAIIEQIVKAQNDIIDACDKRSVTIIELRNTVLKGMLDFIGKREDVYPQLQDISQVASQIGFSIGATGNAV